MSLRTSWTGLYGLAMLKAPHAFPQLLMQTRRRGLGWYGDVIPAPFRQLLAPCGVWLDAVGFGVSAVDVSRLRVKPNIYLAESKGKPLNPIGAYDRFPRIS